MIDSVRHFLSVTAIKRTIEAMPVSKLNKLHWHLVDDEAFTFETVNHPELSLEGAYDKNSRYTINDIKGIIAFAKQNAVNIIPEIDTPGHTRSWGLS
jgi:hexosaminidase